MEEDMSFCRNFTYAVTRKTILCGALLLPGLVWAQSSVTLYGVLDTGLLYTNKSFNPVTGQSTGKQFEFVSSGMEPSTFGISGQEDLGGGLKARFRLESGIDLANGGFDNTNGGLFGRQAWLSLSNNLGEVKAGLQFSPFILALFDSDPRSMAQFGSSISVYADNTFSGTFVSNAVSYKSPKIAGFTVSLLYALGGVPGNFQAGRQYSGSISYDNGTLLVNAAIEDASHSSDEVMNQTLFVAPVEARTIGVGYRFSSVIVKGSFTNYKAPEVVLGGLVGGGDNNIWNLGFDYHVTPVIDLNAGVWYSKDQHDSDNHGLLTAVGASYFLAKRTSLWAQVGVANNHGRSDLGLDVDGAIEGAPGTTVGGGIGILHKF
jgi:predicted porin